MLSKSLYLAQIKLAFVLILQTSSGCSVNVRQNAMLFFPQPTQYKKKSEILLVVIRCNI